LSARSIIQSTLHVARHKERRVSILETEALKLDPHTKPVNITELSDIKGNENDIAIPYAVLVYAVGTERQTFGIPGVTEQSWKDFPTLRRLRERVMDGIESAAFPDQCEEEVDRLMSMNTPNRLNQTPSLLPPFPVGHEVVLGGSPTYVKFSGELHDFIKDDQRSWHPELADKLKITLVE
ncbi:NADH:ubiquinone oxidoreductase, partial [Tulasnella sp. 417]